MQLTECQIEHGQFIYSLPPEERNDYRQIFQFRMLNARQQYINVSSQQQVIETDRNGKAWIIMGVMDILPDQTPIERIKRTVVNRKTGRCFQHALFLLTNNYPTGRKKYYDSSDKVSKREIAHQLGSEHLYCEQSPEKHPKQVRCQQYNGSHPYSRKSWYLPLRLKPTETVRQLICFFFFFKLLISADTSRKDSMINLYTWNRYTIRHRI